MSEAVDNLTLNDDGSRSNSEGIIVHQPWMAQNPDTLKVNADLAKFKTLGEFSEAHMTQTGELGSLKDNTIRKLGDNPTEDEKNAHFTDLGRPESPEKYEFDKVELPEGREADMVLDERIRKAAFEKGISGDALKALHKVVSDRGVELNNATQKLIKDQNDKDTNALKDIWPGDAFKTNVEKSERTFRAAIDKMNIPESLGGKEGMIEEFKVLGFLDESNPKLKFFMAKLFNLIGDDSIIEGLPPSSDEGEVKRTEGGIPVFKSYAGMNTDN